MSKSKYYDISCGIDRGWGRVEGGGDQGGGGQVSLLG